MSNVLGILFVLLALGVSMGGIKVYELKKAPRPEIPRKMVHILMGCVTLTFPYIFTDTWPVLLLGTVSLVALTAVRYSKFLKVNVGSVLHGVERHSFGELYFPLAVMVLFLFSKQEPVLYMVPILMLTFADSTAALIGSSYGRKALAQGTEDAKSLEGSFVFFYVAFMSTLVPLLLITSVGRAETLLISLVMGVLAALIELVSQDGNDNLFIPLLGYAFLKLHMSMGVYALIQSLCIIAVLFVFGRYWNKRGSLSRLGVLGGLVCAYSAAVLGGPTWLVVMLLAFTTYPIFPSMTPTEKQMVMDYPVLLTNVAVGMVWLWIGFVTEQKALAFSCFVLAFSAHQVMNMYVRMSLHHQQKGIRAAFFSVVKALVIIVMPAYWLYGYTVFSPYGLAILGVNGLILSVAGYVVSKLMKRYDYGKVEAWNGWRNALTVMMLTVLYYAVVWRFF